MKDDDVKKEIERMAENRKHYSNTNNPIDFPKIQAGADIHAGDGGYSEGNKKDYEAFVKVRNKSLAEARIKQIMDECVRFELDPDSNAYEAQVSPEDLLTFAELIVKECIQVGGPEDSYTDEWFKAKADSVAKIKEHFGVEE